MHSGATSPTRNYRAQPGRRGHVAGGARGWRQRPAIGSVTSRELLAHHYTTALELAEATGDADWWRHQARTVRFLLLAG